MADTNTDVKSDVASSATVVPDVKTPATELSLGETIAAEMATSTTPVPAPGTPAVPPDETPTETDEVPADDTKPVPYDRFKEVNDRFRTAERERDSLQQQLADPELQAALNVVSLLKTSPEKALAELEPIIEHLRQLKGDSYPDDIKEMLDEGTITKAVAKELTQLRHQTKAATTQLKVSAEEAQRNLITSTWSAWDMARRKTDPDFTPGSVKWNEVNDRLQLLTVRKGFPSTQEEASALAEEAYQQVNKFLVPQQRAAARKVLTSSVASSKAVEPDPDKMTLLEYIMAKSSHLVK